MHGHEGRVLLPADSRAPPRPARTALTPSPAGGRPAAKVWLAECRVLLRRRANGEADNLLGCSPVLGQLPVQQPDGQRPWRLPDA
jgi:hypothetical protein